MDLYYMDYGKRYVPVKHHIIVHNGVLAYTPTKLSAPGFWEVGAQCARADARQTADWSIIESNLCPLYQSNSQARLTLYFGNFGNFETRS